MQSKTFESVGSNAWEAQERRIRSLLKQCSWRKARDEAKPLCKSDRARFLPLLIEANVGLVRAMFAKGQFSDARQVVAYLKTIAPPETWLALETEIAIRSEHAPTVLGAHLQLLDRSNVTLSESQRQRIADQLVSAFQPVQASAADASIVAAELGAIHEALAAVSAEQYDRAAELIRPLPRDSAFRHWKLFIKGLVDFHRGDKQRAERFLAEVPPDTACGRASLPYLHWLGKTNGKARIQDMPENAQEALAQLAAPPEAAPLLLRAEQLWHEDNPQEMYRVLRNGIEALPSENYDWIGTLSDFCLKCLFILPMEARAQYGRFLDDLVQHRKTKSAVEARMLLRILCLDCASDPDAIYLRTQWERFLHLRETLDGVNPRLSSLAYEWLGGILSSTPPGRHPFALLSPQRLRRMLDPQGAVRYLQKSAQLDPENLSVQLVLVTVYDHLKRTSERNRLLDEMTRRFPESKQVLLLAGNRCVDRKAYAKGLAFFERALEQDRLDPAIPESIANAKSLHALEHFRRGRPAEARRMLDALQGLITDRRDDLLRSSWSMALRRGVLELMYGEKAQADRFLAEARAGSPSPEALLLHGYILWKRYEQQRTNQDPFSHELRSVLPQASAARAPLLVRILDFWKASSGAPLLYVAKTLVRDYFRAAACRPFTREEARALIESIRSETSLEDEARPFVNAILKKDAKDPLFRLYQYRYDKSDFDSPESNRKQLNSILNEAVRRKDDHAIQAARNELDILDLPSPRRPTGPFFGDEEDEEDKEDDDDFELDYDVAKEELIKGLADQLDPRQVLQIMDFLRNASDGEIRRLKKTRPKDVPEEFLDMLLDSIRRGATNPKAPSGPESEPRSQSRSGRRKNFNPRDLFEP
jgi:hypothetical protein